MKPNMQHCYNRGCGQQFNPEENSEESCRHHPGVPFFHDAYKGWSCCNKKSVDFTEFLNIKGCTLSKHSNVKPPEPEKPASEDKNKTDTSPVIVEARKPIPEALPRPPVDTPMHKVEAKIAASLEKAIDALNGKSFQPKDTEKEGQLVVGMACKNSGCTYTYNGTPLDEGECQYHPGVPIFHEGMKYWSCCQKKTSDFAVFMSQKGCAYGPHKWFKDQQDKKVVQCRYDWHQTATNVVVSIYAKMYHYKESIIEVNPIRLHVNLVFPEQDNAKFDMDLELRGIIDIDKTTAQMFGTKVEIIMPKAEAGSWSRLDFPNAKLPPPAKSNAELKKPKVKEISKDSEDDGFNLDDVETVTRGVCLTELASKKH